MQKDRPVIGRHIPPARFSRQSREISRECCAVECHTPRSVLGDMAVAIGMVAVGLALVALLIAEVI